MTEPDRRSPDDRIAAAMRVIVCNQPEGVIQCQPAQQCVGNQVCGRWEHRADQRGSLSIEEHAMACVSDMNREDHLGEEVATNYEFDRTDGGPLCFIKNRNRDLEDRVVGLRIMCQAAHIVGAGNSVHGFTPPDLVSLLRRQQRVGRGDDHALLIGQGHTQIVPGLARPFFEVTDGGGDGSGDVVVSRMSGR